MPQSRPGPRQTRLRPSEPSEGLCSDCPFGNKPAQLHMRRSLRPGRFEEICQAVWLGVFFPCHKTTTHDENDEYVRTGKERQCAGSIQFMESARQVRERAEARARGRADND
jgi:hypothetical protein